LYDRGASAYDPVSWLVSGGRWREWQQAALPYLKRQRVLEVGPGTGHLLHELATRGFEVVAVDRSLRMCRISAARARRSGRTVPVLGGDTRFLPFADASFDTLVYTFPAPVVREEGFWREAARVVRPGGRIVLVEGASSDTKVWPGLIERVWAFLLGQRRRYQSPVDTPIAVPASLGLHVRRIVTHGPEGIVWLVVADRL
jgi:ubiquinone/menaquinone biosynthesis C-methylase UbiE